jgi:hypothetical protein
MTTEEQRAAMIRALLEEREGYEDALTAAKKEGDPEKAAKYAARVADVDRSLAFYGADEPPAAKRTSRRKKPDDQGPVFV